jgi:hypothetical protein
MMPVDEAGGRVGDVRSGREMECGRGPSAFFERDADRRMLVHGARENVDRTT